MKTRKGPRRTAPTAAGRGRDRQAILVLGMHRSGTSALTGVLARLGAVPPRTPMEGNEFNPRGYWESHPITLLHDRILQSAGSRWSDWGRFNPGWFESPEVREFSDRLEDALRSEYGESPLFVVKDPRVSRFLPLWQTVLDHMGIAAKVIVSVRHPAEVGQSLARRDGFGAGRSRLLWLRHLLDAELSSRSLPRSFVCYEDLLEDWQREMGRIGREIAVAWPRASAETSIAVADFLTSELRHHRAVENGAGGWGELGTWANQVHGILAGFARGGAQDAAAFEALDRIREEFDRTSEIYGPVVREDELVSEKKHLQARMSLDAELAREKDDANMARTALAEVEKRAVRAETDAKSRAGRLLAMQTDFDRLQATATAQGERYVQREAELQARLATLQAELGASMRVSEEAARHGIAMEAASNQDKAAIRKLEERVVALEEHIETAAREATSIGKEKAQVEALLKQAVADGLAMQTSLAAIQDQLSKTGVELAVQNGRVAEVESANARLSERLADRFRELAAFARAMEAQRLKREELEAGRAALQAERDDVRARLESLDRESVRARAALAETTAALERWRATARTEEAVRRQLESDLAGLELARNEIDARAATLSVELHRLKDRLDAVLASNTWKLGRPLRVLRRLLAGKALAPVLPVRDVEKIRGSGAFDEPWYLARYPDVAMQGVDPILHYVLHGCEEGRDPSPDFSTKDYYAAHPEAASSQHNALLHSLSKRGAP